MMNLRRKIALWLCPELAGPKCSVLAACLCRDIRQDDLNYEVVSAYVLERIASLGCLLDACEKERQNKVEVIRRFEGEL